MQVSTTAGLVVEASGVRPSSASRREPRTSLELDPQGTADEVPPVIPGLDMVDAEPARDSGDLFIRLWASVPSRGSSGRPERFERVRPVLAVCAPSVELLHDGDQPWHEQPGCKCLARA